MLTKLDVVNAQLATMGQSPIEEADLATFPLAQTGLFRLRLASRTWQSRGWWFNTLTVDFQPDTAGVVEFPCGILRIEGQDIEGLSIRGNTIYDHYAQEVRTKATRQVTCIVELAFEDLPPVPQHHLLNIAVRDFQKDYDSTETRRQLCKDDVRETAMLVNDEHTRSVRANRILMPDVFGKIVNIGYGTRRGLPVR